MLAAEELRVRAAVRAFVLSAINVMNLADDDDLFESGLANSLFAIQLMTFIEKSFGIEVGIDDLDIENFKSLNATTAFVMSKRANCGPTRHDVSAEFFGTADQPAGSQAGGLRENSLPGTSNRAQWSAIGRSFLMP